MKKKILLSSVLTIALCFCLILGSTYALFTSEADFDIAVTAGKVEISATINKALQVKSLEDKDFQEGKVFSNGGTVSINEGELVIDKMTPGDEVKLAIDVTNNSNVAVKYRVKATSAAIIGDGKVDLTDALECKVFIDGQDFYMTKDAKTFESGWFEVDANDAIPYIAVKVTFPNGTPKHDNQFQDGTANISFVLEAVQANGIDGECNLILPETTNP
ncbi:MAG: hypothetical protein IJ489_03800 [Clostridia bacterium]|nr:hypothetical protein [Clostridia bacterium]